MVQQLHLHVPTYAFYAMKILFSSSLLPQNLCLLAVLLLPPLATHPHSRSIHLHVLKADIFNIWNSLPKNNCLLCEGANSKCVQATSRTEELLLLETALS